MRARQGPLVPTSEPAPKEIRNPKRHSQQDKEECSLISFAFMELSISKSSVSDMSAMPIYTVAI